MPRLFVCLLAYLINHNAKLHRILCMLTAAVARSSSGVIAIRYVLTSGFVDDFMYSHVLYGASRGQCNSRNSVSIPTKFGQRRTKTRTCSSWIVHPGQNLLTNVAMIYLCPTACRRVYRVRWTWTGCCDVCGWRHDAGNGIRRMWRQS